MALIYQTAEGLAVPTDFSWLHGNCCIHWKALTHHLQVWGSCFWKPAKILKISGQYLTLIFQISLETEQWLKYSEPQHQTCLWAPEEQWRAAPPASSISTSCSCAQTSLGAANAQSCFFLSLSLRMTGRSGFPLSPFFHQYKMQSSMLLFTENPCT